MKREKSCGAVVYTLVDGKIFYLLIKSLSGVYGFPKGHVESGESEEETALREVFEEVGIKLTLDRNFRIEDEYTIPYHDGILKRVVYFLGYYSDQIIRSLETELEDAILVDYQTAIALFQHESNRWILSEADRFIREKGI